MTDTSPGSGPIVVIGAGMAGLGAAATLRRAGKEVVVLERLDVVGGLARTVSFGDHIFDVGPHYFFLDVSDQVNELIKSCMKPEEWHPIDFKIGARIGKRNVPWPPSASAAFKLPPTSILKFLHTSITRNIPTTYSAEGYMRGMFGNKLWNVFLGPYLDKKVPKSAFDETLHRDWWNQAARTIHNIPDVKRDKVLQLEPKLIERYLDRYPQVREAAEKAAKDAEQRGDSADERSQPTGIKRIYLIFQNLLKAAFAKNYKKVLYPPKGVGMITERVAETFVKEGGTLTMRAANVAFEHEDHHIKRVTWDGGSIEEPESVIWTGSIHRMCTLAGIPREELPFFTIMLALLKIRRPLKEGDDLYTYIADDGVVFNRIYYPNRSIDGLCPPGKDSLCVEITRTEFRDESEREGLLEKIADGLSKFGVCELEDIEDVEYMFVPDSYPVYPMDYREKLDRIWAEHDKFDNLRSIGRSGQFWYNNMARSMRVGVETANDILGRYEP